MPMESFWWKQFIFNYEESAWKEWRTWDVSVQNYSELDFTYDSLEHNCSPAFMYLLYVLSQSIMNLNVYLLDEAHLATLDQSQRPKFIFKWIQKLNKKLDATLKNLSNTNVDQETEWLRIETVHIILLQLHIFLP